MGSTDGTLRILLVEDHRDTAEVVCKLLQYDGHVVDVAATLADGLRRCRASSYDVALCDIGLPDGSGLELARTLKRECPGTRFVALTAHGMPREVEAAATAGFDAHLLKPITVDALFAELRPDPTV
jgi:CheY-like chemotaxis protein